MSVVSNAGPLIALARIGCLELLPSLYGHVLIPRAVSLEVMMDPRRMGAQELVSCVWIDVRDISDTQAVAVLRLTLDRGESEAIVLARQLGKTLLMDEQRGRAMAAALGVPHTGTIGVLLAAKRAGLLPSVCLALEDLKTQGVYLAPALNREALRLAGEG